MNDEIVWKTCFKSPPDKVFNFLNTRAGRESFWAESADEENGIIHFQFINGQQAASRILKRDAPKVFSIEYFQTHVVFELKQNEKGGTDLTVKNTQIIAADYLEMYAGWVSFLMCFKAAVDHNIDLRNHDPNRSWDEKYAEN